MPKARGLSANTASATMMGVLTATREMAEYFETVARSSGDAKMAANWVNGDLQAALNKNNWNLAESPIQAERLAS